MRITRFVVSIAALAAFAAPASLAPAREAAAQGAPRMEARPDTAQRTPRDRGPTRPQGPPPPIHVLYLIRHGMYDYTDPADERIGRHLDSLGRVQAKLVGARLASLPVKADRLVSSNFTRAMETADLIGERMHLAPSRDSLIRECSPTSVNPNFRFDYPGEGDSSVAQLERAWAKYATKPGDKDSYDVLVCHGNVIRWFACKALGVDTRNWLNMDVGNGSITAIVVRADGMTRLATLSDTGHLPIEAQTWTGRGAGWVPVRR